MKERRHHNTKGLWQIKRGKTRRQVECMARRLGVPYGSADESVAALSRTKAARRDRQQGKGA